MSQRMSALSFARKIHQQWIDQTGDLGYEKSKLSLPILPIIRLLQRFYKFINRHSIVYFQSTQCEKKNAYNSSPLQYGRFRGGRCFTLGNLERGCRYSSTRYLLATKYKIASQDLSGWKNAW